MIHILMHGSQHSRELVSDILFHLKKQTTRNETQNTTERNFLWVSSLQLTLMFEQEIQQAMLVNAMESKGHQCLTSVFNTLQFSICCLRKFDRQTDNVRLFRP